jgi:hypothetical protein
MAGINAGEFVNCTPLSNACIFIVGTDFSVVWDSERSRIDHIMADKEGLNMIKANAVIKCTMMMCVDWK